MAWMSSWLGPYIVWPCLYACWPSPRSNGHLHNALAELERHLAEAKWVLAEYNVLCGRSGHLAKDCDRLGPANFMLAKRTRCNLARTASTARERDQSVGGPLGRAEMAFVPCPIVGARLLGRLARASCAWARPKRGLAEPQTQSNRTKANSGSLATSYSEPKLDYGFPTSFWTSASLWASAVGSFGRLGWVLYLGITLYKGRKAAFSSTYTFILFIWDWQPEVIFSKLRYRHYKSNLFS